MSNAFVITFGRVLRRQRLIAGLSQEKLGLEAGLQRNYISMLELGERQPTITTIFKLANVLGIKASKLITLVEDEISEPTT
ncbi:helix-turn-helix domain-containing protein [Paucimonas lemoignei]|uniref:helix-turn-helix domain-containing protein n=1 Tax=Paucimonas lemoignei TaxID=29443 RepID=UPI001FB23C9D|nr:helix-turn-helix transcriptional regulator [Paucimonas lemoignei]